MESSCKQTKVMFAFNVSVEGPCEFNSRGSGRGQREREKHVGRIILDVGEYALYPLCGRKGVDSHQIFFSSFLCGNLVII